MPLGRVNGPFSHQERRVASITSAGQAADVERKLLAEPERIMAIRLGANDNWIKSSYSANGACVEVKSPATEAVAVRDSKVQDGPSLTFAPASWTSFVADVSTGRSGHLA